MNKNQNYSDIDFTFPSKMSNIFYNEEVTKEIFERDILKDHPLSAILLIKFQVAHYIYSENDTLKEMH